jgi:KDO2-lipid IV(A) lauroyltransferase
MGALPLSLGRRCGRLLGLVAYYAIPRVRSVTMANLHEAYGDTLTMSEKRRVARGAAANVGIVAAEFTRIGQMHGDYAKELVTVEGLENIDREKGGLFIGSHQANWEWVAASFVAHGLPISEVVRPLDDPKLNEFVNHVRTANGAGTIPREGAGQEILRIVRDGGYVGLLVDQQPRENAAPVTFFGKACWSTIAPVMTALRGKVPVYPITMERRTDGAYTMHCHPPLEMTRTGELHADLVTNCQRCQDAMETSIRQHPDQWLWLHRRWKNRTRLENDWAERTKKKD